MPQFTKKAMMESLLKLLEQKTLDKITVKDIVEDCEINRGTFYYYFSDIYALVEAVFEDELGRILSADDTYDSWQEGFLKATQLAKESKRQLYHAYRSISRDKLEQYLYRVSDYLMWQFVEKEAAGLDASAEDKRFVTQFYVCALVGVTLRWIDDGMQENPEEFIGKMGQLFEGNIRQTLARSCEKSPTQAEHC